jgi:valyl-tRNA synthetase
LIQKEMKSLTTEKFKKKYQKRYEQLTGASRFLTKIWNAYRFLYINSADLALKDLTINPENLSAVEAYFFNEFNDYLTKVTHYFEEYNWHEAFMILRTFFWNDLCDDYLESVKYRFYSDNEDLKKLSLKNLLNLFYKMLLMLSIIMPYITEEIYSIIFSNIQSLPSIHLEQWPTPYEGISKEVAAEGKMIINVIKNLRNIKSKLQIPLNEEITEVIIVTNENNNQIITKLAEDITKTIRIKKLTVKNKPFNTKLRAKSDFIDRNEDLDLEIHFLK